MDPMGREAIMKQVFLFSEKTANKNTSNHLEITQTYHFFLSPFWFHTSDGNFPLETPPETVLFWARHRKRCFPREKGGPPAGRFESVSRSWHFALKFLWTFVGEKLFL